MPRTVVGRFGGGRSLRRKLRDGSSIIEFHKCLDLGFLGLGWLVWSKLQWSRVGWLCVVLG